jgi:integrase
MPAYKDTKRGTWFAKFQVTDAATGARKAVVKRGFSTKREALDYEAKHRTGGSESSRMRFCDLAEKYFDYREQKPRTRREQERNLENHFPLLTADVSRITKPMMMEWYLDLSRNGLDPSSNNLTLVIVKGIFKHGADFYELPNLAAGLKRFPENKKKTDSMVVWTVEEFSQFIKCVSLQEYRNLYYFIFWTGLRRGEAVGLQYTDFDRDRHTVHVWRQITEHGYDDLKTDSSERVLTIPPALWDFIDPILNARDEEHPFIFGGETHLPLSSISTQMNKAIRDSGVKPITLHQLRHSFATNAINSGFDITAVSRYLGHSNINITLSVYTHLLQKTADKMISTINDLMNDSI